MWRVFYCRSNRNSASLMEGRWGSNSAPASYPWRFARLHLYFGQALLQTGRTRVIFVFFELHEIVWFGLYLSVDGLLRCLVLLGAFLLLHELTVEICWREVVDDLAFELWREAPAEALEETHHDWLNMSKTLQYYTYRIAWSEGQATLWDQMIVLLKISPEDRLRTW